MLKVTVTQIEELCIRNMHVVDNPAPHSERKKKKKEKKEKRSRCFFSRLFIQMHTHARTHVHTHAEQEKMVQTCHNQYILLMNFRPVWLQSTYTFTGTNYVNYNETKYIISKEYFSCDVFSATFLSFFLFFLLSFLPSYLIPDFIVCFH